MTRKAWYTMVKHKSTGVLHVVQIYENPTPQELEEAGVAYGEPRHVLRKGKISTKRRRRGIWQHDPDDKRLIYFTCPWCGSIGRTHSGNVGQDYYESIWCGRVSRERHINAKSCGRHLSLYYFDKPKLMDKFNDIY